MKSYASFAVLLACLYYSQSAVADPDPRCPSYEDEDSQSTYFPDDSDCSKFYQCSNGESYQFDCPDGLYYNPHLQVCDWPINVACSAVSSTAAAPSSSTSARPPAPPARPPSTTSARPPPSASTTTTRPPVSGHPRCPAYEDATSPSTYFPHPTDCSKFYQCSNGDAYLFDCPDGLFYNENLQVCDYPYNVKCGAVSSSTTAAPSTTTSSSTTPSTTPSSTAPPTTPAPSTTTPPPSGGGTVTGPPGLCPFPDPAYAVHLPHPDPTKFYHCSHGVAYVKDCPTPLKFNAALEVCDW